MLIVLTALCAAPTIAQMPSGDSEILASGAQLEVLHEGAFFTEGAAVAPDGSVYFSDITFTYATGEPPEAGHIMRYDPETGNTSVFRSPSGMSNGLKFDARGRLLACEGADHGGRRVTRTDMTTGKAVILASHYNGNRLNAPNDLSLDEKGRIYFSDPKYLGPESMEQEVFGVYRIDPDGALTRIITDAGKPNGVAVSPDQTTLYVVSNDNGSHAFDRLPEGAAPPQKGRMALLAYDLAEDGSATFRQVLADYTPNDGPDGLVCDAEGNLYVAVRDATRPGIYVYTPEGEERAYIPTPELPTNVGFGRGATSKTLYVTYGNTASGGVGVLAKIETQQEGYQLPALP
ncbi:MAG: SMP-30/gluconolactonase/LRE family protein [Candidatus Latescibacteria bacterium]|nr:SMP-30/gluconolactonase/LRE family protein [Candidatus Latescibacterota bacterium]MDP7447590.1 SMP-30/gluconolactonase/LRE family protein [Candidatus Latescibacterota bacterium]HJP33229.1 SMP-30/gluconolactonase/LRE family protein [Candidatus Latescibacterota bacterium]